MNTDLSRRSFLAGTAAAGLALAQAPATAQDAPTRFQKGVSPWPLALNASTIRPADVKTKIDATAKAGWDAIELWITDLEAHEKDGGSLKDLGKEIVDRGMFVPNIIGLWDCMPMDEAEFQKSLEATRERMRRSSEVGSRFVAAIPAPDRPDFDLKIASARYRELMRIGREDYNIRVAFEFVGFMKSVNRLGQASGVAMDSDDPAACLIADTFHMFRGGGGFNGLRQIQGDFIANFHWNDVNNEVPREEQGDEHRLYPGDGVLPLGQALKDLKAIGYKRTLSLEIFKREYWAQDPYEVAATGLRKMNECIAKAGV
jgi:sugar phosphate isomerase/epimerase